jgi:hypothetical protein
MKQLDHEANIGFSLQPDDIDRFPVGLGQKSDASRHLIVIHSCHSDAA